MSDLRVSKNAKFTAVAESGPGTPNRPGIDNLILGKRLKHFRKAAGLTLEQLGASVGLSASQLSLYENGKREPKLTILQTLARELGTDIQKLFATEAPNRRSALEIALEQMQRTTIYKNLGLPQIRSPKSVPTDTLEAIVGLGKEVHRQAQQRAATAEGAKQANTLLRDKMRSRNNYLPEIEEIAEDLMASIGHTTGALTHRAVDVLANKLGFSLVFVHDLPSNTRSITDLENGRIYLPPASIPGGHGLRALALQAMAHHVLGHETPWDYAQFLQQRLEINYFASACLMPEKRTADFLQAAKRERNLAIEDLRDAFGVTHEAAAHRFTNLATEHLDLRVHFYRATAAGVLVRGYQNDGLEFPTDGYGNEEGQLICKYWGGRTAFKRKNRTNEFYQYTDTPEGTFWSSAQTGESETDGGFSITCGVSFDDAKWFRGRDTQKRTVSLCPAEECCKRPDELMAERWEGKSWASARMHQHILSPLPSGTFPGVDEAEMYEFLTRHDAEFQG
ncbi:helix-turn-helix transcriptional regulator [Canibacter zhoujuaniae]|uniref:helix-turn-helix transcriptional regulator n=1 Tax=Canibacter zhoujuaniae TaxID=2708343 RepID=UPI0014200E4A|nr:helix-turn-helix transcriptional regulator [Canibacter zhoujuaniae]